MSRTCPDCNNSYDDDILHCPEDGRGLSDVPIIDELIGRSIGSYKVVKQLGKGGMGAVYMGEHPMIGSKVAIKFLHAQYATDAKIVDRFFNEARAVNVIGHDNILKILDLNVTEDNRHYFIMEYLLGRPLQALLKHGASVPFEVTGPILLQICDALEAAHRHNIIHRDLKPDNVYLISMKGKKNFVKVVDFGIARLSDDAGHSSGATQTGTVMGTPAYMSPEQGSGASSKIDARSDVYSLGVMMFQMATGKLPFKGENFGEILVGHLQQPPPMPRDLNTDIPEVYEAIILKCLEKAQEDRYQSMAELHEGISFALDQLGISRDLPQADETDPEMMPIESKPGSIPGLRNPSQPRATGPGSRPRVSNPNVRSSNPKVSNPSLRGSNPNARAPSLSGRSHPPQSLHPEEKSRTPLYVGLGLGGVVIVGLIASLALKSSGNAGVEQAARRAARDARDQVKAAPAEPAKDDEPQVAFLSVISEPVEADVVATWKDGEKRGPAPLSIEVPKNAKVHFEFSKEGYVGYSMDVIADQAQNVHAVLKQAGGQAAAGGDKRRRRDRSGRPEEKKEDGPAKDGLIDLNDALK